MYIKWRFYHGHAAEPGREARPSREGGDMSTQSAEPLSPGKGSYA
jgi:hypothetical protein